MTFIEAIRKSQWVRRQGWPSWILVKDEFNPVRKLTRADLLASDWEPHETERFPENAAFEVEDRSNDDATIRFELLELE